MTTYGLRTSVAYQTAQADKGNGYRTDLDSASTYAAFYRTGDTAQQLAIVSGDQARHMLTHSDSPDRLSFTRIG